MTASLYVRLSPQTCHMSKSVVREPIKTTPNPGHTDLPYLLEHEASFIRLLDQVSNGSRIEVSETGTAIVYRPGILTGGHIEHTCPLQRSIGYFLEPLFMLGPFCKKPLNVTFKGLTNNEVDPSIDMIQSSLIPVLKKFLVVEEGLSLKINKRGLPPKGGGVVHFTCPVRRNLKAFQWVESGKIKKIRGTTYTSRVAPTVGNRMMEAAKGEFLKYLTDVYFTVDNSKGASPGFGMCCVAESNNGTFLTAEAMSNPAGEGKDTKLPEDVGREAAWRMLEEICRGGCVDSLSQPLVLLYMALAPKDICKVVLGPLTPYTMHFLRHLRDIFQVRFKIDEAKDPSIDTDDEEVTFKTGAGKLLLTCVGTGYSNISKGQT
ncbi:unnamed protein product, partial [Meganyctiphanes norvegica]